MANYFQFPLCLLAFGANEKERLRAIIDYNVIAYAVKEFGDTARKSIRTSAAALCVNYEAGPMTALGQWDRIAKYLGDFEAVYGRDARVRIGSSLLWDCYNGGPSYREFSIICAINSILGRTKSPKRITEPSIRVRAAGYKSWDVLRAKFPGGKWRKALLSDDKIRYSLKKLRRRGFFVRARVGARTVLYMADATDIDLRSKIIEREKQKAYKAHQGESDRQLREEIKAIDQAPINDGESPLINDGKSESKTSRHNPDTVPDMSPDMATDINNSSLMKAFNESVVNESVSNGLTHSFLEEKKPESVLEEKGYVLDGKFFAAQEANRLAAESEELLFKFKPAVRRGESVIVH